MKRHKNAALVPKADLRGGEGRIVQILLNVDLRNSHDGLMDIARRRGVTLNDLGPGKYLVFMNEQRNRFKIFALSPSGKGAIVAYYKSYQGRIDRQEIEQLPAAFGIRKKLETSKQMADKLDEELRYLRTRTVRPLNK